MKKQLGIILLLNSLFLVSQNPNQLDLQFTMALEFDRSDALAYDHIKDESFEIQEQQHIAIHKKYEYGRDLFI